jgi:hypothetical protein
MPLPKFTILARNNDTGEETIIQHTNAISVGAIGITGPGVDEVVAEDGADACDRFVCWSLRVPYIKPNEDVRFPFRSGTTNDAYADELVARRVASMAKAILEGVAEDDVQVLIDSVHGEFVISSAARGGDSGGRGLIEEMAGNKGLN